MKPFLKWAGGKRQSLPILKKYIPNNFDTYYEPFVGAGALFFELKPDKAVINDINNELINCYMAIKNKNIELMDIIDNYPINKDFFLEMREKDRSKKYKDMNSVDKAARIIYLNKTCFNGLYRVNKSGFFNVPYGDYSNPTIYNKDNLEEINTYLNQKDILITSNDYKICLNEVKSNDFIYLDPPYEPLNNSSNFTSYNKEGFGRAEQIELSEILKELDNKKIKWMLSNSSADFIKELYNNYNIIEIDAKRSINSKGDFRGKIKEVIITNY